MSSETSEHPVYVVLGASGGIGSSLARILQRRQARMVLAARDEERLRRVADETGGEICPLDANRRRGEP